MAQENTTTRRSFLKAMAAGFITAGLPVPVLADINNGPVPSPADYESHIKDYLHKMQNFNSYHNSDIVLNKNRHILLVSTLNRLKRLQRIVGYGNFHLLSLDDAIQISKNYSGIGRFKKTELNFMEMIFFADAGVYGFHGQKPIQNITDRINRKDVVKIPGSGNYLYRGKPLATYYNIKKIMGDQVVLTSGIRSIIKQFLLFLNKAYHNGDNLSLASRSLAPPGYSYHSIGDFDVGQRGFGYDNFTERFTTTPVFKKLKALNYITLRYPSGNRLGVRFEPWHIKVTDRS